MKPRHYQTQAIDSTFEAWKTSAAVLGVAATGLGKTVIFALIAARTTGRVMVLAHREELIFQAADKIKAVTGEIAGIEMADMRAAHEGHLMGADRIVVSTIQTQNAGKDGGRMTRFDPYDFELLIVDEAHHAVAGSYRRVIDHYRQNKKLKVLGVTATPDRTDEEALGQVFDSVGFEFDIRFGINDGWLVPIGQRMVHVGGLDLSSVRTTAGDLNGADLARVMEYESTLHEIVGPTIELTEGKKTLVFASSLAHAERITEILNRHKANCAAWISGDTPKDQRRSLFESFARRGFQYLVNVGVATEGFDDPGIECVVMARPTKSRSLYAQMIGRGTRPLPGVVDGLVEDQLYINNSEQRRNAIAASAKPSIDIIDFVGNAGRHKLVSTADILAGEYSDEVVDRAKAKAEASNGSANVMQSLDEAEEELRQEREEAKRREAAARAKLTAKAKYSTSKVNPFDVLNVEPWREKGWDKGKPLTSKMAAMLEKQGIDTRGMSYTQARQLISEITSRWDHNKCSFKQAKLLARYGYSTDMTFKQAKSVIDQLASNGWKRADGPPVVKTVRY